ncbi:pentapeptide repeat-containing protein [Rhizobium sp. RU36D]|uniref:pentapeptide repeat-containing protein n=1 Tax=Rhizobium sp. RU36D TaxID=1907415 RepID=UPI0009D8F6B7|nr:pentapeptide repeat-containing protein [Rhizobium sp. RU36D]SMC84669.1 Uncharacterized protein YjbI, contains pentapeptide repeats [Rhizobium sp. RU36D]
MELTTESGKPSWKIKEPLLELIKAAGSLLLFDGSGAVDNFVDAVAALGREEPSEMQTAHRFWRTVLLHAITDVVARNKLADRKTDEQRMMSAVDMFAPVLQQPMSYNAECLEEPTNLAPYRTLRDNVWDIAIALQPGQNHDKAKLAIQLDTALREAVAKVWLDAKSADFRAYVHNALSGPVFTGVERRQAWQRHYAWIDHKLSKKALFGQEDTGITLRDVYVPLRCNHHEEVPVEGERDEARTPSLEKKTRRVAHVGWLHETLWAWLDGLAKRGRAGEARDCLRVVAGVPGSGKTVFSRTFAYDVAMSGRFQVAYVELQHMAFKSDLEDRIRDYFKPRTDGAGLGGDVFDMVDVEGTSPVLFVFDGLDELSRSDEAAKEVSRKFLRDLRELLGRLNRNGLRAAGLVLGRSAAVEEARAEADLKLRAILHVMPLKVLDRQCLEIGYRFHGGKVDQEDIVDPDGLAGRDDRPQFWARWLAAARQSGDAEAKALNNSQLDDLTAEPLLFYLLIISGYAEQDADKAADNRNHVYREIFRRVHQRDKGKDVLGHASSVRLDEDGFFHLMECLALAIWQGGGRTGSKKGFEDYRDAHAHEREEEFEKADFAQMRNVALQFYTRAIGDSDQGFEFVHKSFGEYLAACAILRAAQALSAQHRRKSEDFCTAWVKLFGAQPVTSEILGFLRDEARLLAGDEAIKLKEKLTRYMNWVLAYGMPAHRDRHASFRMAETHQRNATGTLLACLNALAGAISVGSGEAAIRLVWPDESAARRLIEMLQITHDRTTAHHLCLGYLDFGESNDLSYLALTGVNLIGAHLSIANLRGACLIGGDIMGANLSGANLAHSKLILADFSTASLVTADLSWAILNTALLNGADLRGADLSRADLSGADLSGADLSQANTSSANFSGSLIVFADLQGAEGVTDIQINSAFGNIKTQLPTDMARPDHWSTSEDVEELYEEWRLWLAGRDSEPEEPADPQ